MDQRMGSAQWSSLGFNPVCYYPDSAWTNMLLHAGSQFDAPIPLSRRRASSGCYRTSLRSSEQFAE